MAKISKEELFNKISAWVDEKENFISESCAKVLRYKTISGPKTEPEKEQFDKSINDCIEYIKGLAERFNLKFVNLDGKVNYIEQPEGTKVVAIPTHIDVVPVGGGWRYPPFEGVIARGKVWGRGAQDDKGPMISCLFGLYALKELGLKFHTKTRILLGTGEEVGDWSDIQYYGEKMGAPDFGFTPDGYFPIINGEKGIMNLNICLKCDPKEKGASGPEFLELTGGDRSNIVPDQAMLSFKLPKEKQESVIKELENDIREFIGNGGDMRVDLPLEVAPIEGTDDKKIIFNFKGEASHAMAPWNGHNAISDAFKYLMNSKYCGKSVKIFSEFVYKATLDFYGKGLDIYAFHDFIGPTTINMGIVRLNTEGGKITINVRPPIGLTCEEVRSKVTRVLYPVKNEGKIDIFLEPSTGGKEALYLDPKEYPLYFDAMKTAYQKITKQPAECKSIGGTTYAKALSNTICFGPVLEQGDEKELAHMKDECVTLEQLKRNTKIYAYSLALMTADVAD